jgi:hypothetical protein
MNRFLKRTATLVLTLALVVMPPSAEAFVETPALHRAPPVRRVPTKKSLRPPPSVPSCPVPFCRDCPPPDLLVCRAVGDFSDDAASDNSDSSSEASSSTERTHRAGRFAGLQQRVFGGSATTATTLSLKERLLKASNFASMLCVLDCTILPMITIILPLFGIVAASPAQMEGLHELGHQLALWFVLPVGGLATTLNYNNHRKLWISALGWLGLTAVVAANAGCHVPLPGGALGQALHHALHTLHHGILHRVTNLAGCALLLTSNYLSHRQGACKDPSCGHTH